MSLNFFLLYVQNVTNISSFLFRDVFHFIPVKNVPVVKHCIILLVRSPCHNVSVSFKFSPIEPDRYIFCSCSYFIFQEAVRTLSFCWHCALIWYAQRKMKPYALVLKVYHIRIKIVLYSIFYLRKQMFYNVHIWMCLGREHTSFATCDVCVLPLKIPFSWVILFFLWFFINH